MSVAPHTHTDGACPVTGLTGTNPHAFCPPHPGDSRAPCPAMNSMANHGYLPRDGKCITPGVLIHALRAGYHLSYPLAWFLTHGGFYLIGQRRKRKGGHGPNLLLFVIQSMRNSINQIPKVRQNGATHHNRDLLDNPNTGVAGLPRFLAPTDGLQERKKGWNT